MRTKHFWYVVSFCIMAQAMIICCQAEAFPSNSRAHMSMSTHTLSPQVSLSTTTVQGSFILEQNLFDIINMFNTQPADKIFHSQFASAELSRMDTLAPGPVELSMGHIYSVGDHSRNVLKALDEIPKFKEGSLFDAYEKVNSSGKLWILRMAALFHDCGKGADYDLYLMHPAKGANKILALMENAQIKLDDSDAKMLRWLIIFHDHMSFLSSKRDIYDEDTLIEFMHYLERFSPDDAKIAVDMLYLLSYADATGMNMKKPTNIYRALMQSLPHLHSSMQKYLSANRINETSDVVTKKIAFLTSIAPEGINDTLIRDYADITPAFIIAPHRAINIKKQLTLLKNADKIPQPVVQKILGENFTPQLEITVVTKQPDTIGLLSRLTAIFYLNNLNIRHAEINMTQQGVVLDRFVATYNDSVMTDWTITDLNRNLEEDMARVFKQGMSLQKLFAVHNRPYSFPVLNHPFFRFKTKTNFESYPTHNNTEMVLETTDRLGIIHLVSRALFKKFQINILSVNISTEGYNALDTFLLEHQGAALSAAMAHEVGNYIEKLLDSVNGNSVEELQELIAPSLSNVSGIITNASTIIEQAI
jgi:UTP:GlnB (protein PII) uridylyltransferase